MGNFIFTIVAENYLPLAQALAWSLKKYNKTPVTFIVFIADKNSITPQGDELIDRVICVPELGLNNLNDLAFKYNVTEFCTAIKPTCFKYLFDIYKAENVIYFDPDIFIFNDILPIFQDLTIRDIVITPHHLTPQVNSVTENTEARRLYEGIYNFGFVAFKKGNNTLELLDWWENKLFLMCYADIQDALHTDQKWGDFFPVFSHNNVLVSTHIGYNFAPWNIFEREIFVKNDSYYVRNRFTKEERALIFAHFAGYDPNNLQRIHKYDFNKTIDDFPEYNIIRAIYNEVTNDFSFIEKKNQPYGYAFFSNGKLITDYHRRLYRSLVENGYDLISPFQHESVFYKLLDKAGLIDNKYISKKYTIKDLDKFDSKIAKIELLCKVLIWAVGSKRYFMLLKFVNRFSRPENQTFLLGKKIKKFY